LNIWMYIINISLLLLTPIYITIKLCDDSRSWVSAWVREPISNMKKKATMNLIIDLTRFFEERILFIWHARNFNVSFLAYDVTISIWRLFRNFDASENNMKIRRRFYRWTIKEDPTFFQYVFSDETLFHHNGPLNIIVIIYIIGIIHLFYVIWSSNAIILNSMIV